MAYIGRQLARGENKLFDDISSSFNGSTTVFNLTVSSVATSTATPYQLFVSLGGVMQKPNTDFTTAGNQITFTTAPAAGLSCWIMMQGDTIDQAAIPDASVTPSKISGSNFAFSGDLRLKDADGSHYVGFASPSTVASNKVWTLPAADGSASQYLQTNGSGVLAWSTVSIGGATGIDFNDNVKARFGTGNDLEIFHNASNSVINDAGTGDLLLQVGGSTKATVSSTGFGVTGALTVSTNATISGNLTVSGTTTTVDSVTLSVKDKNIEMGVVSSPSDTTADGGGITLKGASDKTFNWVNATDAWTSSEHIHLIDNKKLFVGGASGTTDGLEIVHNGSNSILNDSGTGTLQLQLGGSTKLEIQSGGINVTGAINVNGSALSTAPEITATASGAIAQHKAVGVNSNGTITDIKITRSALGTPTATASVRLYDDASSKYVTVAYDPDEDIIFAGWEDSDKYRVMAGRMAADGTITWGSRNTAAGSGSVKYDSACYNAHRKCFVLAYKNGTSDTSPTTVQTATVNTETLGIAFHNTAQIGNGSTYKEEDQTIVYDSNSYKCIVGVRENATPYKTQAWIVTVGDSASGYSITTSDTNGQMADSYAVKVDFCMGANSNFMGSYKDVSNSNAISVSLKTLNGSGAWTSNTAVQLEVDDPSGNVEWTSIAYDSNADKYIVAWSVPTDSNKLFACTLTVTGSAGSESISKGTTVEVSSGTNRHDLAFDSTINQIACRYMNDNMYLKLRYLAISGTNITVGNEVSINSNNDAHGSNDDGWTQSIVHCDTAQRMFLIHSRGQDSNRIGFSTVSGGTATNNLSTYIGYANTAIADTASGAVAVTGNVNEGQSGLTAGTKYFLQKNGSLATTADTPSVEAGIALSSTSLLIKG